MRTETKANEAARLSCSKKMRGYWKGPIENDVGLLPMVQLSRKRQLYLSTSLHAQPDRAPHISASTANLHPASSLKSSGTSIIDPNKVILKAAGR